MTTNTTPAADPPRTTWDKVVTSTPVILTVIATVLAGFSTSEMTQAQYFRSLAAQHQSKAGDQWGFFQAKRIRGTNQETTVELLETFGYAGPFAAAEWRRVLGGCPARLRSLAEDVRRLRPALQDTPETETARQAVDALAETLSPLLAEAEARAAEVGRQVGDPDVALALAHLEMGRSAAGEDGPIGGEDVAEALQLIRKLKDQRARDEVSFPWPSPQALEDALHAADANDQAFEAANDRLRAGLIIAGRQVERHVALVRRLRRPVQGAQAVLSGVPGVATNAAALGRAADALQEEADRLNQEYRTARSRFTAHRYAREASYNQLKAQLYEVELRRSSAQSERHRSRSRLFMFGMLAAQGATTLATLAMALRRRSVLWLLASGLGLSAMAFAGVVYGFDQVFLQLLP